MIRVVLDTNVYISAIIFNGKPGEVIDLGREDQIEIYISRPILGEIEEILKDKFNQPEGRILEIILDIRSIAKFTNPKIPIHEIKDCEPDNRILECAFECRADFIVTGDKHLLKLKSYKETKILKPKEFLDITLQ